MVALLVLVVASSGGAQLNSECDAAEEWHLREALKWSVRHDQAYHLGAAEAAARLAGSGGDCSGWSEDAQPFRVDESGNLSQEVLD